MQDNQQKELGKSAPMSKPPTQSDIVDFLRIARADYMSIQENELTGVVD
jgi:hypothetical protein